MDYNRVILIVLMGILSGAMGYSIAMSQVATPARIEYNYNMPTVFNGHEINGFFDQYSGILSVYTQNKNPANVEHTLLHEFGHYQYYLITGEEITSVDSENYAEHYAATHKIIEVN